jgi:hypothetical protein
VDGLGSPAALSNLKSAQIIRKVLLRQIAILKHIKPD